MQSKYLVSTSTITKMVFSHTFTFTGKLNDDESVLTSRFNPPIHLNNSKLEYVMALISLETYNAIRNISSKNNQFQFGSDPPITIPNGAYEIADLNAYINSKIADNHIVQITANSNTFKTEIKTGQPIDFTIPNSVGPLLGFEKRVLDGHKTHESDWPCQIVTVNSLLIDCSITTGNYKNGEPAHTIHQFFPNVPPGFKIVETPSNVIYLPVSVRTITDITLQILDQDGKRVNFGEEIVTVTLHLKGVRNGNSI